MEESLSFDLVLENIQKAKRDPKSLRLAAVTVALLEVVEDKSAAKVYASVVTALERTAVEEDNLSTQAALLELLALTIPHVEPVKILQATLPLTSRVLRAIVATSQTFTQNETKDGLGGANAVLRWSCKATAEYIKALGKISDEKAVNQLLSETLISLLNDRRPKVRKAAQGAITEIVMADNSSSVPQKFVTSFVRNKLKRSLKQEASHEELLHVLSLLETSLPYLNFSKVSVDLMELLVKFFQTDTMSKAADFVAVKVSESTPTILSINGILNVFLALLEYEDMNEANSKEIEVFVPRLLATLLQAKPSIIFRDGAADTEILLRGKTLYGQVIIRSCARVSRSNTDLMVKLMPVAVQMVILLSTTDEDEEDNSVAQSLLIELTQYFREEFSSLKNNREIQKCFSETLRHLRRLLDSSFRSSWDVALKCVVVLMQHFPEDDEVPITFDTLLRLHNEVSPASPSQHAVDDAVSTLVQGIPIHLFWEWINWRENFAAPQLAPKEGISTDRSWLLGLLKTSLSISQAEQPSLVFFEEKILGLARVCDRLAASRQKEKVFHQSNVVELWSLFPVMCRSPSDVSDAFPRLATVLGKALEDKRYPQLVSIICTAITTLIESLQDDLEIVGESLEQTSKLLLPTLFRIVSESGESQNDGMDIEEEGAAGVSTSENGRKMQSLSNAISSLSLVAPSEFLLGMFKKLMQKLLEEIQSDQQQAEKICSYLFLAQALVASGALDESGVTLLYRTLKALVKGSDFNARVQKRAYKVLLEMCTKYHSFVTESDRLKELSTLLTDTITSANVSARAMRLKCMIVIVEGLDEMADLPDLSTFLAEVLLCLKDTNAKTREAAYQLLLLVAKKDDLSRFLQATCAALGAQTPHMRSAAVMALSRLVYEFAWDNEEMYASLSSLLRTVLVLIDENSREVIKSVVGFIRVIVTAIEPSHLEPLLPELVSCLLKYQKHKDRFRAKIKIILKKLIKKFGYEKIMPYVPESESRLLTHMRKLDERQQRRKESAQSDKSVANFDDMLESDEEDSDDGRTLMTGATGFSRMTGTRGETIKSDKSGRSKVTAQTMKSKLSTLSRANARAEVRLPSGADGEIVDMLDSKVAKKVKFAEDHMEDSDDDSGVMEFNDDGKLIVRDEDDRVDEDEEDRPEKKRRFSRFEEAKAQRDAKGKKKNNMRQLGAAYKSKKAGGDVKKKGQKYEPYAFVPLDGRSYTKKNRKGAVEQMSTVVKTGKRKR